MISFFTTAKPFSGHSGIIQRNALQSWKRLHPDVEVILFGDDPGAAEVAAELGLRHHPEVQCNEYGTKRLDFIFARAQEIARHDLLCYINCDIILLQDFARALARVHAAHPSFLMVGRRWDTDIDHSVDLHEQGVDGCLQQLALQKGVLRTPDAVDYFAFPRGLYKDVPELVVGRIWWDHWLVWKARQLRADVVDVSKQVTAIHQNHGYAYHPAGAKGVWQDEQALRNYKLAGGRWHLYTIADATHILDAGTERRNAKRFFAPYWRVLRPKLIPAWFALLGLTRPVRHFLGLRPSKVKAGNYF